MRFPSIAMSCAASWKAKALAGCRRLGQVGVAVLLAIVLLVPAPARAASYSCGIPLGWWESAGLQPLFTNNAPQVDCDFQQWAWSAFVHYMQKGDDGRPLFLSLPTTTKSKTEELDSETANALASIDDDAFFLRPRLQKPGLAKLSSAGGDDLDAINQAGSNGILVDQNSRVVYYSVHMNKPYHDFAIKHMGAAKYDNTSPTLNFPIDSTVIKASWMVADDPAALPKGAFVTKATLQLLEDDPRPGHEGQIRPSAKTQSDVNVALVGAHVVGVVKDHPEFIWATFEHKSNSPDLPPGTVPNSSWPVSDHSFSIYKANTSAHGANQVPGSYSIDPVTQKVSPITNAYRQFAYGGAEFSAESPKTSGEARVDDINSINASFQAAIPEHGSQISPEFANYNLIGSVWLDPSQTPLQPGLDLAANSIGSISLANSTMETFVQGVGTNCFSCHNTTPVPGPQGKKFSDKNIAISHIIAGSLS